jgi:alkylation response protein AidB-like acyl-CoA dehydrogenase
MDFDFTAEQKQFAERVRHFAREHLAKDALKRAHAPGFPFDVAALMAQQGLLGITLPESEGGQGGTLMDAVIAIMEVAAACPRSADVVQFGNFGPIRTFAEYGTPAQKTRWLDELLSGRAVMSLGMTEPDAGSAVTDLKTSARADGAHYVINGSKVFATFSPDANVFLVYVRFGPGLGGIGSVLIECGTPGFSIGAPQAFMKYRPFARLGPLRLQCGARLRAAPRAIRPAALRIPRLAVEVRRYGDQARQRRAAVVPRRRQCRSRLAVGLRDRRRQGGLQPGRL